MFQLSQGRFTQNHSFTWKSFCLLRSNEKATIAPAVGSLQVLVRSTLLTGRLFSKNLRVVQQFQILIKVNVIVSRYSYTASNQLCVEFICTVFPSQISSTVNYCQFLLPSSDATKTTTARTNHLGGGQILFFHQ